jgi:hypothetical protein
MAFGRNGLRASHTLDVICSTSARVASIARNRVTTLEIPPHQGGFRWADRASKGRCEAGRKPAPTGGSASRTTARGERTTATSHAPVRTSAHFRFPSSLSAACVPLSLDVLPSDLRARRDCRPRCRNGGRPSCADAGGSNECLRYSGNRCEELFDKPRANVRSPSIPQQAHWGSRLSSDGRRGGWHSGP